MEKLTMSELQQLRAAAGIPRIVLADKAGVSRFRLYAAENNLRQLTDAEYKKIRKVLSSELEKAARSAAQLRERINALT